MSFDVTGIAPSSGNSWKPEIGDTVSGLITYVGTSIGKNFDGDKDEEQLRIDIEEETGETVSVWAVINTDVNGGGGPKIIARIIREAVVAAGATSIEVGGRIVIKRIADLPQTDPKKHAAKFFEAAYKTPTAAVSTDTIAAPAPAAPAETAPQTDLAALLG